MKPTSHVPGPVGAPCPQRRLLPCGKKSRGSHLNLHGDRFPELWSLSVTSHTSSREIRPPAFSSEIYLSFHLAQGTRAFATDGSGAPWPPGGWGAPGRLGCRLGGWGASWGAGWGVRAGVDPGLQPPLQRTQITPSFSVQASGTKWDPAVQPCLPGLVITHTHTHRYRDINKWTYIHRYAHTHTQADTHTHPEELRPHEGPACRGRTPNSSPPRQGRETRRSKESFPSEVFIDNLLTLRLHFSENLARGVVWGWRGAGGDGKPCPCLRVNVTPPGSLCEPELTAGCTGLRQVDVAPKWTHLCPCCSITQRAKGSFTSRPRQRKGAKGPKAPWTCKIGPRDGVLPGDNGSGGPGGGRGWQLRGSCTT